MDPRIERLADTLVNYSTKVKKGDRVKIYVAGVQGEQLSLAVYKKALQAGAIKVSLDISPEGMSPIFYKYANDEQLRHFSEIEMKSIQDTDVFIGISAETNPKRLMEADSKKMAIRAKVNKPIFEYRTENTRWIITRYPTTGYAEAAGMCLEDFTDFYFSSVSQNWSEQDRIQERLKQYLDKVKEVRLVAEGTDLTLRKDDRPIVKCVGERNMPDGEIYFAPLETSANGKVAFSFPLIHLGNEMDGVELKFENGVVVDAKARLNQQFLHDILETDEGSKKLGEFGIGTNFGIERFVKTILFDEKIGGTVHLALGSSAFKTASKGLNESGIHMDMLVDLRKTGEIYTDGKLFQKNGKFVNSFE